MTLDRRSLIFLLVVVSATWLAVFTATKASADGDPPIDVRQQIIDAGLAPWNGRRIPLDETLRGQNREKVSLHQLLGKPVLAYNYAEW